MANYTIDMKEWPTQGKNNYIHPTAMIGPNVTIGDNNYIGPYCIIGFPAEHKDYWDKPVGHVIIGNNNKFAGLVTVDAGTEADTIIFNNCWLLKHSHVGHDAIIHDNVTLSCGAKIGGHAVIHANTNIGLNACIHQRVQVPEGCMIGMNAAVTKKTELKPYRKYAGVPAKDIGPNITYYEGDMIKKDLRSRDIWHVRRVDGRLVAVPVLEGPIEELSGEFIKIANIRGNEINSVDPMLGKTTEDEKSDRSNPESGH